MKLDPVSTCRSVAPGKLKFAGARLNSVGMVLLNAVDAFVNGWSALNWKSGTLGMRNTRVIPTLQKHVSKQ